MRCWNPGPQTAGENLRRPDELAGTVQQELQDPPFGRREPERLLLTGGRPPDLVRGQVDQPLAHRGLAWLVTTPSASSRRSTARSRASSSAIANGLVT